MTKQALVLVDERLPVAAELMASAADVRVFSGREFGSATRHLSEAEGLIVRSISRVDQDALLAAPRLRAVASATIGLDHVDAATAGQHGIEVARAPGCNAPGVADWVLWALLSHAVERSTPIFSRSLGIVGVGMTGGALRRRAQALGFEVHVNDPPRAEQEPDFDNEPLADILGCDAVSLHVPLTDSQASDWPTRELMNVERLQTLRPDALLLNASRGAVMVERWGGTRVAIDTWRGEPRPSRGAVAASWRATPHVAGATTEGKWRAQTMAAQALAKTLELDLPEPPKPPVPTFRRKLRVKAETSAEVVAAQALEAVMVLGELDRAFREATERGESFDALRDAHRRHELESLSMRIEGSPAAGTRRILQALGFQLTTEENANLTLRID